MSRYTNLLCNALAHFEKMGDFELKAINTLQEVEDSNTHWRLAKLLADAKSPLIDANSWGLFMGCIGMMRAMDAKGPTATNVDEALRDAASIYGWPRVTEMVKLLSEAEHPLAEAFLNSRRRVAPKAA